MLFTVLEKTILYIYIYTVYTSDVKEKCQGFAMSKYDGNLETKIRNLKI